jgi:hypothetical protein
MSAQSVMIKAMAARKETYVLLVPLPEGGSINLNDGALDKSIGPDQLVIRGVVNLNIEVRNNRRKKSNQIGKAAK